MGITLNRSEAPRGKGEDRHHATVVLSRLALEALTGEGSESEVEAPVRMESALRCYLGDKGTERPAWLYPNFLRGSETREEVQLKVEFEEGLWRAFEDEAAAQGVTVAQLAEHAAFYFAAELNAGRLTERILEDLRSTGGVEGD
jgi:hypothetical protein